MTPHTNTSRRRAAVAVGLVALALTTAACGDSASTDAAGSSSSSTADAGSTVVIDTFRFSPDPLQVGVGDTVTWTNGDAILHTVTSGTREYDPSNGGLVTATDKDGMFDEQLDGKGSTAEFTFTEAGTYHYFCDRHPGMEGDIEVS